MDAIPTKQKWTVFAIVAVGIFISLLSATSINVALPIIGKEFNAPITTIQWIVTTYLLVISSVLPIFGWLGDMTQRKYVIASGFFLFGLGGFLCSFAPNIEFLIVARIVQGIGASMNMANSYAAITNVFPVSQRGRALGMNGSVVALGGISGPAVGGFLLEFFGWQSIFYMTIPFAIVGVITALVFMPASPKGRPKKEFDALGAVLLVCAISSLIIALSQGGRPGWSIGEVLFAGILSIVLFYFFYKREKAISSPLVEIDMFKNKTFLNGNIAGLCAFLALNSNNMLLPFYLHNVLGSSAKTMGMILILFPLTVIVVAPLSGALSDKYGASRFAITGMSLMTLTMVALALSAPLKSYLLISLCMVLFGGSNAMFQSPNNSTTLAVIPTEKHGMAGSIVALMRNFGAVVGTAISVRVCDMVMNMNLADKVLTPEVSKLAFISGYQAAILLGAFFALLGALFSFNKKRTLAEEVLK